MSRLSEPQYREHHALALFQTDIASAWYDRADQYRDDPFVEFFFLFASLNALYFLWKKVDDLSGNEQEDLVNLIHRLSEDEADQVLGAASSSVEFFAQRPIQRMDKRKARPSRGHDREGRRWAERLAAEDTSPQERLAALGHIIYQVRSNLVHGSKMERGDDEWVVKQAVSVLRALVERSLESTTAAFQLAG